MKDKSQRFNRIWNPLSLLCAALFIIMLVLTALTPLGHDDYSYSFSFYDDTRIRSVTQIVPSMIAHRQLLNGRVIPHAMVQFFLMLPKSIFNVVNAVNSALLCYLLSRFLVSDTKQKTVALACGAMALWAFMPGFGDNCLWLDGAINYPWGYCFYLLFLMPFVVDYLSIKERQSKAAINILHLLIAFVAGAYSENASLVVILIACCLMLLLWNRDRRFPRRYVAGIVMALIGWGFLMSAPSTSTRSSAMELSAIGNNLARIISLTEEKLLWLFLLVMVLLIYVVHYGGRKQIIILASLFVMGSLVSLLCFAFAAYFIFRHFCCTVFLLVFAIVILVDELLRINQTGIVKVLSGCLAVYFAFQFSLGALDIVVCQHKAQLREQTIISAIAEGKHAVTVENFIPMTGYSLRFHLSEDNSREWPNIAVGSYYGIEEVYGVDPS